jgi:hypothetical protein
MATILSAVLAASIVTFIKPKTIKKEIKMGKRFWEDSMLVAHVKYLFIGLAWHFRRERWNERVITVVWLLVSVTLLVSAVLFGVNGEWVKCAIFSSLWYAFPIGLSALIRRTLAVSTVDGKVIACDFNYAQFTAYEMAGYDNAYDLWRYVGRALRNLATEMYNLLVTIHNMVIHILAVILFPVIAYYRAIAQPMFSHKHVNSDSYKYANEKFKANRDRLRSRRKR